MSEAGWVRIDPREPEIARRAPFRLRRRRSVAPERAAAPPHFATLDEMAAAMAGAEVELIRARPGSAGGLVGLALEDVTIQWGWYGADILSRARLSPSRTTVLVPLTSHTSSLWDGRPAEPAVLVAHGPGGEHFASNQAGLRWVSVTADPARLIHRSCAAAEWLLQPGPRWLLPTSDALDRLRAVLRRLRCLSEDSARLSHPGGRRSLTERLLSELGGIISSDRKSAHLGRSRCVEPGQLIRRVDDHLERRIQEPPPLADLCAAAGVCERTLQYAFGEMLGVTPMRYVKLRRLARVHRLLRRSDPGHVTVTRVALDWGFSHLSQFAHDYKTVYGETPSVTLRRAGDPVAAIQ